MTDNEIIEKVTENLNRSKCLEPFEARDIIEQKDIKIAELTEEINRQKAEVERLKEINNNRAWFCGIFNQDIDNLLKEMTKGGA